MSVQLWIQDPGTGAGGLLEQLALASREADSGGGIFAWTNQSGVLALFDDEDFEEFLDRAAFELVIGVDAITDPRALQALAGQLEDHPNLTARVFLHDENALFHPKMAWFQRSDGRVTLLTGSGNLTMGGLKNNWEVFVVSVAEGEEAESALEGMRSWMRQNAPRLRTVDDPRVVERARQNKGRERDLKRVGGMPTGPPAPPGDSLDVLVAEIPRAGPRWGQANFDRSNYEDFFDATVGSQRRVVLYHVNDNGALDPVETRPSVEVQSQNYRFELAAAKGIPYPNDGRPVGVFVKVSSGTFVYDLLLPGDEHYNTVVQFLDRVSSPQRPDRMRRVRTTVRALKQAWPDATLWQVSLDDL